MSAFSLEFLTTEKASLVAELGKLALEQTPGKRITDEDYARFKQLGEEIDSLEQKIREMTIAKILHKNGIQGVPRFPPPLPDNDGAGSVNKRSKPE